MRHMTLRSWRGHVAALTALFALLAGPAGVFATTTFSSTGISTTGDLQADGNITMNSGAANTILIGQNGTTPDTVTIAGDLSLTDTQWSVSNAGAAAFASVNGLTVTTGATGFKISGGTSPASIQPLGGDITFHSASTSDLTLPSTGTLATLDGSETLTNKTLTSPTLNGGSAFSLTTLGLSDGGTHQLTFTSKSALSANGSLQMSFPLGTTMDLGGNVSTSNGFTVSGGGLTLSLSGLTGVTLPTSGTLATLAGTETLTNKTLTSPKFSTIVNTGTLTLPTSTDTLVGRATTDTLTNKTLTSPTINGGSATALSNFSLKDSVTPTSVVAFSAKNLSTPDGAQLTITSDSGSTVVNLKGTGLDITPPSGNFLSLVTTANTSVTLPATGTLATLAGSETLSNKTLSSPVFTGGLTVDSIQTDGGVDRATAGDLAIGASHATSVTVTPVGIFPGGIRSNAVDRSTAGTFTVGGTNATAVTITPATTVTGALTASGGVLTSSLDRATAGNLTIGGTNATSVTITPAASLSSTLTLGTLTSDPTGANGMTYYNSTSGKFRCFESSAWKDCDTAAGVTLSGSETLSNKTLVSPKIQTGLFDVNGNSEIAFNATTSAVNGFTVFNSQTGGDVLLAATGTDSNIGMRFQAKGLGSFQFQDTTANADFIKILPQSSVLTNSFAGTITSDDLTGNRSWNFPDAAGQVTVLGNTTTGTGSIVRAINPNFGSMTVAGDLKIISGGTNELMVGSSSGTPVHIGSFAVATGAVATTGTGYSASIAAGSTDTAGTVTVVVNASTAGTAALTFATAYSTSPPFCVISPASAESASDSTETYVTSTQAKMTLNFSGSVKGGTEAWNYHCIE
jgi:hypothetical protein